MVRQLLIEKSLTQLGFPPDPFQLHSRTLMLTELSNLPWLLLA
jgi:hypothetical protein